MTFGRQSRLLKPIFVVGCPRSGTTVIGRCLSAHPDVGGSDESMFLGSLARIYQNFYVGDNPRAAAPLKNYISEDDLLGTLGRCSDDIFGSLLARLGRPRYLDHTPWYSRSIDFIDRLYPDAVFIHVIRDGRDVVASLEHSYRSGYWWAGATQTDRSRLWVQLVSTCQQSATRLSLAPARRYIEVSYEQLCSTPFRQLGDLLDFLDLPLNAAVFEPLAEPHTVPSGTGRTLAIIEPDGVCRERPAIVGNQWPAHWRDDDNAKFLDEAGDLLRSLGYNDGL